MKGGFGIKCLVHTGRLFYRVLYCWDIMFAIKVWYVKMNYKCDWIIQKDKVV